MVELLQGTIEVKSEIDQYAQFIVNLPQLEVTEEAEHVLNETPKSEPLSNNTNIETAERGDYEKEFNQPETTILMIDDNKELLWMLKDILSDEYSILTAENGEEGLVLLKQKTPDLIITDIMMPKIDGITLIKQLKSNKHTMHIPLIILSAKNTTDEKIEGIESGADAYIPKPFNTQYLRSIIKQLLKKQEELKQYYNSSASAFEFSDGQLLQQEDKKFMETAVELINENMDNTEFGPEELAEAMQTSSRNLYRKFKNLDQLPPKDFIKEQRINYAAKLLLTTTLTIQEIMYRTVSQIGHISIKSLANDTIKLPRNTERAINIKTILSTKKSLYIHQKLKAGMKIIFILASNLYSVSTSYIQTLYFPNC